MAEHQLASSAFNPWLARALKLQHLGPWAAAAVLAAAPALALGAVGGLFALLGGEMALLWWYLATVLLLSVWSLCAGVAFFNAQAEAELARKLLLRQAQHDELTRLKNRSGLHQLGKVEILRARRMKRPLSIAILDVDGFARINRGYGREVGDRVLAELARLLQESMREYDVTARFGGEEFVLLLPETDHRSAARVVSRYLDAVRRHRFVVGNSKLMLTVSGGLATYSEYRSPAESLHGVMQRAAAGLAKAKEKGGNRCCVGPTSTAAIENLPLPLSLRPDDRSAVPPGGPLTS